MRLLKQPLVAAGLAFVLMFGVLVAVYYPLIDIALHRGKTMGAVISVKPNGALEYGYTVKGRPYTGHTGPTRHPYPRIGSAYEVCYSTVHPNLSRSAKPPIISYTMMLLLPAVAGYITFSEMRKRVTKVG